MKEFLKQINEFEYVLPKESRKGMNVDARIIGNKTIIKDLEDEAVHQLSNVAMLPGIIEPAWAMPDMHFGYGLPMGAVAAFREKDGIISSGMTGFDINCGINLIKTNLTFNELKPRLNELNQLLFKNIPCGVGSKGKLKLTDKQLNEVLVSGVNWAVENGYGTKDDIKNTEENGCMEGADPSKVSETAKKRGKPQLGTLGAGNHFLELQKVSNIFDEKTAKKFGIDNTNQVTIMLHCGSRGLGHEIASDYLKIHEKAAEKYKITLPDKQLACAPINSKEGQDYFAAMKAAVNYSFTNRLIMTHWIRETFETIFKKSWEELEMKTVYGIAHNICKKENYKGKEIYIHRKGATRSMPDKPVLIAGSMGTASYILKGTEKAEKTFYSSCHGAGRAMSRHQAIRSFKGNEIKRILESQGKSVCSTSPVVLAEEAPEAYKDIEEVIGSVHGAGISTKVVKVVPVGIIKG
ncbi:MAG: RtcB family protein [Candidatus Nanoarchaeia archaeon]|nr:RtcB family protein [Candidatus Nanoarchaeia archaeon]